MNLQRAKYIWSICCFYQLHIQFWYQGRPMLHAQLLTLCSQKKDFPQLWTGSLFPDVFFKEFRTSLRTGEWRYSRKVTCKTILYVLVIAYTNRLVITLIFVSYRVAATLQLLIFFFIAVLAFHPASYMPADYKTRPEFAVEWPNFFRMPVLMLMLITLLNDGQSSICYWSFWLHVTYTDISRVFIPRILYFCTPFLLCFYLFIAPLPFSFSFHFQIAYFIKIPNAVPITSKFIEASMFTILLSIVIRHTDISRIW